MFDGRDGGGGISKLLLLLLLLLLLVNGDGRANIVEMVAMSDRDRK